MIGDLEGDWHSPSTESSQGNDEQLSSLAAVPLFPLPDVILFPRCILPLHIFESRYRQMTADALAGDRLIGMAILKAGFDPVYQDSPPIHSTVCVGRIVRYERLADGRYNLLLEGVARAVVQSETTPEAAWSDKPYRVAEVMRLQERRNLDIDLETQRRGLESLLKQWRPTDLPMIEQFRQMLQSPMSTATVLDLITFHLLEQTDVKLELLTEADVVRRAEILIDALRRQSQPISEADGPLPNPNLN